MSTSTPDRSPQPRSRPALSRACDRLSHAGVYLLPVFYVGFATLLFLLWRAPGGAFWLPAASGVLAGTMGIWALVFHMAGATHSSAQELAAPRTTATLAATRAVPLRFVHMTTRACSHACTAPDGARARFTVSCFHARCSAPHPNNQAAPRGHADAI